jgi:hypothetical protein
MTYVWVLIVHVMVTGIDLPMYAVTYATQDACQRDEVRLRKTYLERGAQAVVECSKEEVRK